MQFEETELASDSESNTAEMLELLDQKFKQLLIICQGINGKSGQHAMTHR